MIELTKMTNRRMAEKIVSGEAIDISNCKRDDRYYVLPEFFEDVDYCDAAHEWWVWSIGRRHSDGVIHASLASDLYQNDDYHCLFLR